MMAHDALKDGFTELLWVDADMAFKPSDVDMLLGHEQPFVCGIYPKKGTRAFACHLLPGTSELVFGEGGGLVEILYAAGGFTLVRSPFTLRFARSSRCRPATRSSARPSCPTTSRS